MLILKKLIVAIFIIYCSVFTLTTFAQSVADTGVKYTTKDINGVSNGKLFFYGTQRTTKANFEKMADIIAGMINSLKDATYRQKLNGQKFVLISSGDKTSEIDALQNVLSSEQTKDIDTNTRGVSNSPLVTVMTEEMICKMGVKTRFDLNIEDKFVRTWDQVVHETAHTIEYLVVELKNKNNNLIEQGIFNRLGFTEDWLNQNKGPSLPREIWALSTQIWFNANPESRLSRQDILNNAEDAALKNHYLSIFDDVVVDTSCDNQKVLQSYFKLTDSEKTAELKKLYTNINIISLTPALPNQFFDGIKLNSVDFKDYEFYDTKWAEQSEEVKAASLRQNCSYLGKIRRKISNNQVVHIDNEGLFLANKEPSDPKNLKREIFCVKNENSKNVFYLMNADYSVTNWGVSDISGTINQNDYVVSAAPPASIEQSMLNDDTQPPSNPVESITLRDSNSSVPSSVPPAQEVSTSSSDGCSLPRIRSGQGCYDKTTKVCFFENLGTDYKNKKDTIEACANWCDGYSYQDEKCTGFIYNKDKSCALVKPIKFCTASNLRNPGNYGWTQYEDANKVAAFRSSNCPSPSVKSDSRCYKQTSKACFFENLGTGYDKKKNTISDCANWCNTYTYQSQKCVGFVYNQNKSCALVGPISKCKATNLKNQGTSQWTQYESE